MLKYFLWLKIKLANHGNNVRGKRSIEFMTKHEMSFLNKNNDEGSVFNHVSRIRKRKRDIMIRFNQFQFLFWYWFHYRFRSRNRHRSRLWFRFRSRF